MRGRHVLMETLVGHGVEYLFGNAGHREPSDREPAGLSADPLRAWRCTRPSPSAPRATTRRRAGARGVVNLPVAPRPRKCARHALQREQGRLALLLTAGKQIRLRRARPLLGHDLVAMAAPLVKWSAQVERADEMARLLRRALKVAQDPPSGPECVALPIDVLEQGTARNPRASRARSTCEAGPRSGGRGRRWRKCSSAAATRSRRGRRRRGAGARRGSPGAG